MSVFPSSTIVSDRRIALGVTAIMLAVFVGIVGIGMAGFTAGYEQGYRSGQIDALENQWSYQRVVTADGKVNYIKLEKATTREGK